MTTRYPVTIPPWVPSVPPASDLNSQQDVSESMEAVAKRSTAIPVCYGKFQTSWLPCVAQYANGTWTVLGVVCMGEIEALDFYWIDGALPVSGVQVSPHLGTTVQTVDSLMSTARAGFTDTLVYEDADGNKVGVAYVVIQYTDAHYSGLPEVIVEGRGRKVYDPRAGTTAYSVNPALCLADLISNDFFGLGDSVNQNDLEAVADACDETVNGSPRREIGLTISNRQDAESWVQILRAYAGCWANKDGGEWRLIADGPRSADATVTDDDIVGIPRIGRVDENQVPTQVRVVFTDTSPDVWRTRTAAWPVTLTAGTPRRISEIRLPGVQRFQQAMREAHERYLKLVTESRTVTWRGYDEQMARQPGDIVDITHTVGLANDLVRVTAQPRQIEPGLWEVQCVAYDAGNWPDQAYSDTATIAAERYFGAGVQLGITTSVTASHGVAWVKAADGGAWSPTSQTTDITFTFYRAGSQIAQHVVRFTLNQSTGNISAATQGTPTGEDTTLVITGNNSPVCTARVTHDDSAISHTQSVLAVQGGSEGTTGTGDDGADGLDGSLPFATFAGQVGAFGDLYCTPNQTTTGANDGEIKVAGHGGASWVLFQPGDLAPRTAAALTLNTPWEGDVSTTLDAVNNVFYVVCGSATAQSRFGASWQTHQFFTATYAAATDTWTAYANLTTESATFSPLSTDVIVAIGYKSSTTGGIDHLTQMVVGAKMTETTATAFLDSASITTALIKDAAITNAKVASLDVAKLSAGTMSAAVTTSGKIQSGKTTYGSGTGFLMEYNGGTPRFDVGSPTRYMRWSGSDLVIGGDVVATGNIKANNISRTYSAHTEGAVTITTTANARTSAQYLLLSNITADVLLIFATLVIVNQSTTANGYVGIELAEDGTTLTDSGIILVRPGISGGETTYRRQVLSIGYRYVPSAGSPDFDVYIRRYGTGGPVMTAENRYLQVIQLYR